LGHQERSDRVDEEEQGQHRFERAGQTVSDVGGIEGAELTVPMWKQR
jgi:hypothetical protein